MSQLLLRLGTWQLVTLGLLLRGEAPSLQIVLVGLVLLFLGEGDVVDNGFVDEL